MCFKTNLEGDLINFAHLLIDFLDFHPTMQNPNLLTFIFIAKIRKYLHL